MQANRTPIIESIRDYILTCQFLKEGKVNIDYLPNDMAYSIEPIGSNPIYKRYTDGKPMKQFQFGFLSKEAYDGDARTEIANSGFYQYFEEWIEENSMLDILPNLDGYEAIRMDVVQSGYLFSTEDDLGRYQIICRLIYQ
ncbi:MAG: hypothetical protein RSD97_09680 [Lachnospiraceae bacterium]